MKISDNKDSNFQKVFSACLSQSACAEMLRKIHFFERLPPHNVSRAFSLADENFQFFSGLTRSPLT